MISRRWFEEKIKLVNKLYIELEKSDDIETLHQYRVNLRKLYAWNLDKPTTKEDKPTTKKDEFLTEKDDY